MDWLTASLSNGRVRLGGRCPGGGTGSLALNGRRKLAGTRDVDDDDCVASPGLPKAGGRHLPLRGLAASAGHSEPERAGQLTLPSLRLGGHLGHLLLAGHGTDGTARLGEGQ